jgi:anaphase-promoting complex subunit 3
MKSLNLILLGALCFFLSGCAQLNYMNQKTPSELAMYGTIPRDEVMAMQTSYVKQMVEKFGSREKASSVAAQDGWNYIKNPLPNNKSSLNAVVDLAMRSFNGAWILNENNYEAHWGFGVCSSIRGWLDEAQKHFAKAMELNPKNADLILDVAFNYTNLGAKNNDSQQFDKAIMLYSKAIELAPDDEFVKKEAYSKQAYTLYYKGDYASAWGKVKLAEQAGWKCPEHDFLEALSKQMPRPK